MQINGNYCHSMKMAIFLKVADNEIFVIIRYL